MYRRITAGLAIGALTAVPVALVAAPAHADVERHGACGSGRYELSVDRENGGFEVSVDLDRLPPGQRWKVVLRHDGAKVASVTRRADHAGDIDLERFRANTGGKDVFRFTAKRVGGTASCGDRITVR